MADYHYEVWREYSSRDRSYLASFANRNEADRLCDALRASDFRLDWEPVVLTVFAKPEVAEIAVRRPPKGNRAGRK